MVTLSEPIPTACSFTECARPIKSKTHQLCSTHYKQKLRGDELTPIGKRPTCSIGGCEGSTKNRGYCSKHYTRWLKHGDPHFVSERISKQCIVPNCSRKHYGKGFCEGHYTQVVRNKQTARALRQDLKLEDALTSNIEKTNQCWNWTGWKDSLGYGRLKFRGEAVSAHRASYSTWVGSIPDSLVIDHICHNTSCVNPDHLRVGTHKQNMEHRTSGNFGARSKFQGVSWASQSNKWRARVQHDGATHEVGLFTKEEDAAEAARMKRIELYTFNIVDRSN